MLSLKSITGVLSLLFLLMLPIDATPPGYFENCHFENNTFEHGDLVRSFPPQCMQLYCNNGTIEDRYYDTPMDCNCCEFNGKMYKPGEKLGGVCIDMKCCNGSWKTDGCFDECCSMCNLKNDPHITTFDKYYYNWHCKCNYSISQHHFHHDAKYGIYGQFRECDHVENASCIGKTTFTDNPHTVITINYDEGPFVSVNSHPYVVKETVEPVHVGDNKHSVLAWRSDNCNMFLGSQGYLLMTCPNEVFVWAYPNLANEVNGLCGHYNWYQPDDFTDRFGIQHPLKPFPFMFPYSWMTNDQSKPHCPPSPPIELPVHAEDPCNADPHQRHKLKKYCTDLLKPVCWEDHYPSDFILDVAIRSCVEDICLMKQNDVDKHHIEDWKKEMISMLKVNIKIEVYTKDCPHSEDSEYTEHSEDSEHSLCSESGCKNPRHIKANMQMNLEIEFGNRRH